MSSRDLAIFTDVRRYASLVCIISETRATLTDEVIDLQAVSRASTPGWMPSYRIPSGGLPNQYHSQMCLHFPIVAERFR